MIQSKKEIQNVKIQRNEKSIVYNFQSLRLLYEKSKDYILEKFNDKINYENNTSNNINDYNHNEKYSNTLNEIKEDKELYINKLSKSDKINFKEGNSPCKSNSLLLTSAKKSKLLIEDDDDIDNVYTNHYSEEEYEDDSDNEKDIVNAINDTKIKNSSQTSTLLIKTDKESKTNKLINKKDCSNIILDTTNKQDYFSNSSCNDYKKSLDLKYDYNYDNSIHYMFYKGCILNKDNYDLIPFLKINKANIIKYVFSNTNTLEENKYILIQDQYIYILSDYTNQNYIRSLFSNSINISTLNNKLKKVEQILDVRSIIRTLIYVILFYILILINIYLNLFLLYR